MAPSLPPPLMSNHRQSAPPASCHPLLNEVSTIGGSMVFFFTQQLLKHRILYIASTLNDDRQLRGHKSKLCTFCLFYFIFIYQLEIVL